MYASSRLPLLLLACLPCVAHGSSLHPQQPPAQVLFYKQPAAVWNQALPIGNGRVGAMVFGGANAGANNGDEQDTAKNADILDGRHTSGADEHLQLNESTLWQGSRTDRLNPRGHESFLQARKLLLDSHGTDAAKIAQAESIAVQGMIAVPPRMPGYSTLGDLYLRSMSIAPVTEYRRELDLQTGIARTRWTQGGVHYRREVFASSPAGILVMRVTADKPHSVSVRATMDRPADFAVHLRGNDTIVLREGPAHSGAIRFAGEATLLPQGATAQTDGSSILVKDADAVTVEIAAATSFGGGDPEQLCEQALARSVHAPYANLLAAQLRVYKPLFERMTLALGKPDPALEALPTDERMRRVAAGADDLGLQQLYFQFARYLLLSSSAPGGLPANLQGIWASSIDNPWGSKWTINVNTEMNYWLAEPAALPETVMPLVDLVDRVRTPGTGTGAVVAQRYYGARGFVIHHNTDAWGDAEPIDGLSSGIWPMGGAWLALHAWDHYAYTLDRSFLASRAWPILLGSSQFFLDYLTPGEGGYLVTGPSLSPENRYKLADGSAHSLTMAPTMDIEIVREVFNRTLDAGRILHTDEATLRAITEARDKLPPFRIGSLGQLQEWQQDYAESAPGHRHISHLWALFPGSQISLGQTPELARAAQTSLERRLANGGGQTGWSRAWVINYWDRLHRGDQAYDSMQVMFRQSTFPNMMDTHPPGLFQIDGNLGAANGMLEALVHSELHPDATSIELLPALPSPWSNGSLRGVRVRGGGVLDMTWSAGRLTSVTLRSLQANSFRIQFPAGTDPVEGLRAGQAQPVHLQAGEAVTLHFK